MAWQYTAQQNCGAIAGAAATYMRLAYQITTNLGLGTTTVEAKVQFYCPSGKGYSRACYWTGSAGYTGNTVQLLIDGTSVLTASAYNGNCAVNPSGISSGFGDLGNSYKSLTISHTEAKNITIACTAGNLYNSNYGYSSTPAISTTVTLPATVSYPVTYNANGGTGAPAAQTKYEGEDLVLSSTKPTKANETANGYTVLFDSNGGTASATSLTAIDTVTYTFKNWNTNSNGTGSSYASGATYSGNASLNLYAIYSSSISTRGSITTPTASKGTTTQSNIVTFNGNGGTCSVVSKKSEATTSYTFNGWYNNAGTKIANAAESYTPTANITLIANWTSSQSDFSSLVLPTADECAREGHTLLGWNTTEDATTALYSPGQSITASSRMTLYAIWQINTYTINFNANGGSNLSFATKTISYSQPYGEFPVAEREGYFLSGWSLSQNGTNIVNSNTTFTETSNITLYARWVESSEGTGFKLYKAYIQNQPYIPYIYKNGSFIRMASHIFENIIKLKMAFITSEDQYLITSNDETFTTIEEVVNDS